MLQGETQVGGKLESRYGGEAREEGLGLPAGGGGGAWGACWG